MSVSTPERGRVLIVDDDRRILDLLVELLELDGYEVLAAPDGAEALPLAHTFNPDVVVSDVVMPVVGGLELCRRLKEDPRTSYVPVLLISGIRKSNDAGIEGLYAGADDYLDLPFRNEELLVKVARLVERHRVGVAIRESEERYRELFENANDIIYTHDLNGNFTSLNRTGERITGYSREEAMKMNVADVIAPDYLNLARDMIAHKTAEHVSTVYEIDIISRKRRRVRLEVSTRLIFRDGKPIGVQGIARDLTERKHSEEALRETQAFFNSFMDNSPAVAFMKDDTGRYVYVNKPFERLFGQTLDFLRGRTSFDWLPPETAAQTHEHDLKVLSNSIPEEIIETVPTRDGTPHHWLVFKFPTIDSAGNRYVAGVGVDISERRRAEEALAQQAQREAMAHRISQAIRCSLDSREIYRTAVRELGATPPGRARAGPAGWVRAPADTARGWVREWLGQGVAGSGEWLGQGSRVRDSTLPSGSRNQAILAPPGAVQMPRSSCPIPSYRVNATPPAVSRSTAAATSGTSKPSTVYGAGTTDGTSVIRSIVPRSRATSANGRSSARSSPSVPP